MLKNISQFFVATILIFPLTVLGNGVGNVAFNQMWIEHQQRDIDVADTAAVFSDIFSKLPDRAFVWPTENYYYFSFTANGRNYSGNFRLHPDERDEGFINFAFFDASNPDWIKHALLGPDDGVDIEKLSEFEYAVSTDNRKVVFELNPISQQLPDAELLAPDDHFIGRTFDESGLVFILVFNEAVNQFIWILDSVQMAQTPLSAMSREVSVHVRSGFVFLHEPQYSRQILIGVDNAQVARNTYYDGPFDQLADNWIHKTRFKEFAERSNPQLLGKVNARGEFINQESRMAVMPYMHYHSLSEIWNRIQSCGSVQNVQRLPCLLSPQL